MPTKTITAKNGERVLIPSDATIKAIIYDGNITATSECKLPTPTSYKCGFFVTVMDDEADSTGHPFDETTAKLKDLYVGDQVYNINMFQYVGLGNDGTLYPTHTDLNAKLPGTSLFKFVHTKVAGDYSDRKYLAFYFKAPAYLFDSIKMSLDERNNGAITFYVQTNEVECGDYSLSL